MNCLSRSKLSLDYYEINHIINELYYKLNYKQFNVLYAKKGTTLSFFIDIHISFIKFKAVKLSMQSHHHFNGILKQIIIKIFVQMK